MDFSKRLREAKKLAVSKPSVEEILNRGEAAMGGIAGTAMSVGSNALNKAQSAGRAKLIAQLKGSSELVALVHVLDIVCENVSYSDLSSAMQTKMKTAGLGLERGIRTGAEAQSFFDSTVPDSAKLFGEDSVWRFLDGKDASHIESFKNSPDLVKVDSNYVWEAASSNRARGEANMAWTEQVGINFNNGFENFVMAAGEIVPQAVLYSVIIEATISIIENSIYVHRGHKDVPTALQDTAVNVGKSAIMGLISGVLLSGAIALGAAPFIAAVAPILGVIGAALLIYTAGKRIHTALTAPDPALDAHDLRKQVEDMPDPNSVEVPIDHIPALTELKTRFYDEIEKRGIFADALAKAA